MDLFEVRRSINYRIYHLLYNKRNWLVRRIPVCLVSKHKDLGNSFEIGITTYIDRYEGFFKPRYRQVRELFPDVRIRITVNSFYDEIEKKEYLKRIEDELCWSLSENVIFVLHEKPKGLTKLWNEILSHTKADYTQVLNDDLEIFPWFRHWLEGSYWKSSHISLLERTWSSFLIARRSIDDIGWFNKEFQGFSFEDMDYTARCLESKVSIANIRSPYLRRRDHKPVRRFIDKKSGITWERCSDFNRDQFFKKWKICSYKNEILLKQLGDYDEPKGYQGKITRPERLRFCRGVCYPDRIIDSIQK